MYFICIVCLNGSERLHRNSNVQWTAEHGVRLLYLSTRAFLSYLILLEQLLRSERQHPDASTSCTKRTILSLSLSIVQHQHCIDITSVFLIGLSFLFSFFIIYFNAYNLLSFFFYPPMQNFATIISPKVSYSTKISLFLIYTWKFFWIYFRQFSPCDLACTKSLFSHPILYRKQWLYRLESNTSCNTLRTVISSDDLTRLCNQIVVRLPCYRLTLQIATWISLTFPEIHSLPSLTQSCHRIQ